MELNEEQVMLQQTVRELGRTLATENTETVWCALANLGLLGIRVDEKNGGAGMDAAALRIVVETLAAFNAEAAMQVLVHNVCVAEFVQHGGHAEHKNLLDRLIAGDVMGAGSLSGGASNEMTGRCVLLEGLDRPIAVCYQGHLSTYAALSEAIQSDGAMGLDGLVVTTVAILRNMSDKTAEFSIDSAPPQIEGALYWGLSAILLGLSRAAFERSVRYVAERTQFGRALSDFQAIQWMIADSDTELDALDMVIGQAALTGNMQSALEAAILAIDVSRAVTDRALQMHGGYGFTKEYQVERQWRDARYVGDVLFGGGLSIKAQLGRLTVGQKLEPGQ